MTTTGRLHPCPSCSCRQTSKVPLPIPQLKNLHSTAIEKKENGNNALIVCCPYLLLSVSPFPHFAIFPCFYAVARTNPSNQHQARSRDCRTDSITCCCSSSLLAH